MNSPIEDTLKKLLTDKLLAIEAHLNADVLVYNGNIGPLPANVFLNLVEDLQKDPMKHDTLFVILTTNGGSAEMVERYVNILRHHYREINFIVPDYAYSAGTIKLISL